VQARRKVKGRRVVCVVQCGAIVRWLRGYVCEVWGRRQVWHAARRARWGMSVAGRCWVVREVPAAA